MPNPNDVHAQNRARSHRNLENARQRAAQQQQYDSNSTRTRLTKLFEERHGAPPYDWQLDVTEAILLGLDSVVIAGTSAGKTMPFMMPLLLDEKRKILVISPLKLLQINQAQRFKKLGLSAVAVNGDSWNSQLEKELKEGCYQAILASPEMCLKHDGCRKVLQSSCFDDICAIVVDEAHCIRQWGADFRPAYKEIGKLRAFFPSHIPIVAVSATLNPAALLDVRSTLGIDAATSFFLNLGNDRPNVAYSIQTISSPTDFEALKPLLSCKHNPTTPDDLIKSVVFVNSIASTQLSTREVRSWFPLHLRQYIDFVHAIRSPGSRQLAMRRFETGKSRILFATEAAGMGTDIPDIEQVIQFGVPSSLAVWIQRAGRAGRSPDLKAFAILLVETSVFQRKRKKRKKKTSNPDGDSDGDDKADEELWGVGGDVQPEELEEADVDRDEECDVDEDLEEDEDVMDREDDKTDDNLYEWGKKIDLALRKWIETPGCRRVVVDEHFENPPKRKPPTHICCDNCNKVPNTNVETAKSHIPDHVQSSPPASPSKSTNLNRKRALASASVQLDPAAAKPLPARRGALLEQARDALQAWRLQTKQTRYNPSSVTAISLLPDSVIRSLSSARHITNVQALRMHTGWIYAERHGDEVLEILQKIDGAAAAQKEAIKAANAAARLAAANEKLAEKAAQKAQRVAEKEAEAERRRVEKEIKKAERDRKAAEKEQEKLERERGRAAKRQKAVIEGCSSFSLGSDYSTPTVSMGASTSKVITWNSSSMIGTPPRPLQSLSSPQVTAPTPLQVYRPGPDTENVPPPGCPRPRPRPRPISRPINQPVFAPLNHPPETSEGHVPDVVSGTGKGP